DATVPVAPGLVSWVRFDIPRDAGLASYSALDIDLVGSTGVPSNDFSMALYTPAGVLVARAFDNGPGLLPQITVGPGTRTRNGDGLPYDGSDQTRSPQGQVGPNLWPDVPAGTCYVAVCSGNDAQFGAALWSVTPSQQANTGTAVVRVRNYRTIPAVAPVGAQDLGLLQGVNNGVVSFPSDPAQRSKWFRFLIFTGASDASGKYIDIDTANTTGGTADTNIALYNSSGVLVAANNDILPGYGADNPTGGNSALSFGATTPARTYSALNPNMPPGDGRNGQLTAGVYYLHVSECCAGFGADRFWVINDYVSHLDPGSVSWAVRTNYAPPCGFSDVGRAGGAAGADNRLDNNDFVAFVSLYFQQAQAADMGTQGGFAGRDGVWDNNDFVVFVDGFFAAPASCR
ncbi:MAG: hypothetical protein K2Q09_04175, partial [Phycisphaerales bacterium]|nr:hypothetical protein [Phycisphaerales bacterium]